MTNCTWLCTVLSPPFTTVHSTMRLGRVSHLSILLVLGVFVIFGCYLKYPYDVRNHKWLFKYNIRSLPSRESWLKRGFMRGADQHTSPRFVERHTPINRSSSENDKSVTGRHTVLFYNRPDIFVLDNHNGRLQRDACPYKNCEFIDDTDRLSSSSAVVFTLSHGQDMGTVPPRKYPGQVWIFTDHEPPVINTDLDHRHRNWDNMMNWSMTYRVDSEIVKSFAVLEEVPPAESTSKDYRALFRGKTGFAVWPVSNCGRDVTSGRNDFVRELQQFIPVNIFGKCGTLELDRKHPERTIVKYKFLFAFENSLCLDYVSEKFYDRYDLDTIIVTRGAADYDKLFPNDTFVNTRHFSDAKSLADFLIFLNSSEEAYTNLLRRKNKYRFKLTNWECDMCTKLNMKEKHQRTYRSISEYWHDDVCYSPDDIAETFSFTYRHVVYIPLVIVCIYLVCIKFRAYVHIRNICLNFKLLCMK